MATYITLRIDNPDEAADLVRDMAAFPDCPILTPGVEHVITAVMTACGGRPYVPGATEPAADRELFLVKAEMIGVAREQAEAFLWNASSYNGFDDAFHKLVEAQP